MKNVTDSEAKDRFCSLVSRLQDVELVVKMWPRWFFGWYGPGTNQSGFIFFRVVVVLLCISSSFIHFRVGLLHLHF